jgi:hypothetical protein
MYNETTEKKIMKNKQTIVANSRGNKNKLSHKSKKTDLVFERNLAEAGFSKRTANEIQKWYTNSK